MSIIGDGIDILKLVDKGRNADLYKQIGEWIDRVADLQKQNDALHETEKELREQLKFKGTFERIGGHTFVEGDDEEVCPRCAEVNLRPVHLILTRFRELGTYAVCPECDIQTGARAVLRRADAGRATGFE